MIREFTLPDVGEGVAEGELVSWLVEPGDTVVEDQPIAEVETDKALVEIPSPYNGTVADLRADPGDVVPVGDVLITFDIPEEADTADAAEGTEPGDQGGVEPGTGTGLGTEGDGTEARGINADLDTESEPGPAGDPQSGAERPVEHGEDGTEETVRVFAPPSVRRLARELGVDLAAVAERVSDGRPSEADVRAYVEDGPAASGATTSGGDSGGDPAPELVEGDRERKQAVTRREDAGESDEATGTSRASETDGTGRNRGASGRSSVRRADRDRTLAAPATRRVAREADVDINAVPTDRTREGEAFVTADQVREYAARTAKEPAGTEPTVVDEPAASGAPTEPAAASEPEPAGTAGTADSAGSADAARETGDAAAAAGPAARETVAYRGIRRTIGERMIESTRTAAHVTHHDTAEVSALVDARERLTPPAEERGIRLTYLPFVMKAVVAGLQDHPIINSRLHEADDGDGAGDSDQEITLLDEYNLGVAVATDAGLLVPVVEDVDRKGLFELARETRDLAERARKRELTPAEMRGGTFTLTNFGAIGGEYATPIINRPESAILGLGAIEERPVAVDGAVVARPTLPLSLSIDHRVIDGADAARFTNGVIERLEAPVRLLE